MRVFRLETDCPVNIPRPIRQDRYGAFVRHLVGSALYEWTPCFYEDFGMSIDKEEYYDLFFAFPTFDTIVKFANDLSLDLIVAEYEVDPMFVSSRQVVFNKHAARFIAEVPLVELVA